MRYVWGLIFIVVSTSCIKPNRPSNEILKVELARGGAWSDPGAVISIDNKLNYEYYGLLDNSKSQLGRKYYKGKISEQFWDTLNNKLDQIKYKTIDTLEAGPIIEDASCFELLVYEGKEKRRIIRADIPSSEPLTVTLLWLNSSYKNVKLQQVSEPFKFETYEQDPPRPSLKQVRFPPPIRRQ